MAKRHADYGVLLFFAYPVHTASASEVSRIGVGAQVFSFDFCTAVFHPTQALNCLLYLCIHSLACRRRLFSEESSITSASIKKEGTHAAGYVNYV